MKKTAMFACFLLPTTAVASPVIDVYTTNMGFYSNPDNEARPGLFVEIMQQLEKASEISFKVHNYPWKRSLQTILANKNPGLIFPLMRTPAREHKFKWIVSVVKDQTGFVGAKKAPDAKGVEDFMKYRIGVIRGSPFEKNLKYRKFQTLDSGHNAETNAKKLQAKRIDYWYVTGNTASNTFRMLGYDPNKFKIQFADGYADVSIGANLGFSEVLAAEIEGKVVQFMKTSAFTKLLQKYGVTTHFTP